MTLRARWRGAWKTPSPERPDYAPPVQERGLREGERLRLSPGNSKNISDTIVKWNTITLTGSTRGTLLTPTVGKRLRLIRINIAKNGAASTEFLEFYYGTAANIIAADRPIDAFNLTTGSSGSRTWTRGQGPLGNKDEVLSARRDTGFAGGEVMYIAIEYSEEK